MKIRTPAELDAYEQGKLDSAPPATKDQTKAWKRASEGWEHEDPACFDFKILSLIERIRLEEDCLKSFEEHHVAETADLKARIKRLLAVLNQMYNVNISTAMSPCDEEEVSAIDEACDAARKALFDESPPSEEDDTERDLRPQKPSSTIRTVIVIMMGVIFSAAILVVGYPIFDWLYLVYQSLN